MNSSGTYHSYRLRRAFFRIIGKYYHFRIVKHNKNTRILVILHLYYMSAWPEIQEYLKNLSPYNYTLIVTCMNGFYDNETLSRIKQFKNDVRIIKCDNYGWDLRPFLIALRSVDLSNYDILYKLQSKGTKRKQIFVYGQYFRYRSWFLNLFEGCIGPFTVHTTIRNLMDTNRNIGIVAAKNLIVNDPIHKQHMVEKTLREFNFPIPKNYRFVAGSCFATRANLMNEIQTLDIDVEKFKARGFSLAHRLERVICFPSLWKGLKMEGPRVLSLRRSFWFLYPFAWWWKKYNGVRILNDPRVHVEDEFAFDCIEPCLIKEWKFVNIKVGKIRRRLYPNKQIIVPLYETLPYKYIVTKDPLLYNDYCVYNQQIYKNYHMSQERFDNLIYSLEIKGDTNENNIVITESNIILDGQHRCCWLLYSKGPNHIINALFINKYYPKLPFIFKVYNSLQYRIPLLFNYILYSSKNSNS